MGLSTWRRSSRRAVSYAFFLTVALVVSVIGVTALTVGRIELREQLEHEDRNAGRLLAQSAVQRALFEMYSDASWRTSIAHDTWSSREAFGDGQIAWKLVDPTYGALDTDETAAVRVYGVGAVRAATWIYSVLVQPPVLSEPPTMVTNGDFDGGTTTGWTAYNGCDISIAADLTAPLGPSNVLMVEDRDDADTGPQQSLTATLQSGETYRVDCWAKLRSSSDELVVDVVVSATGGTQVYELVNASIDTNWAFYSGSFSPSWSGTFQTARFIVGTVNGNQDFYLEDVKLTRVPKPVGIIPGTWRREAQ